ncbi:MAG: hypothetical protein AAFQ82_19915, partial [Myxococcota bacterium]
MKICHEVDQVRALSGDTNADPTVVVANTDSTSAQSPVGVCCPGEDGFSAVDVDQLAASDRDVLQTAIALTSGGSARWMTPT